MRKSILFLVSLLVVMSMLIAACGGTPEPEIIEKEVQVEVTRVVEVEGEKVIETVVETVIETVVEEKEIEVVVTVDC
jgi:hypothetical protein